MDPFKYFHHILSQYIAEQYLIELPKRWTERHRAYHTVDHLVKVIQNIETSIYFKELNVYEKHALLLAAFFHDVVYEPKHTDNEDKSIEYFLKAFKNNDPKMVNTVKALIECTKYRKRPYIKLERILWDADNKDFLNGYNVLLNNEKLIRKEYSHLSKQEYKEKRIKFLESCKGLFSTSTDKDLDKLIEYINKTY